MIRVTKRTVVGFLSTLLVLVPLSVNGGGGADFIRGDPNGDTNISLIDGLVILNHIAVPNSPPPTCFDAADVNDNGVINVVDAVHLLGFLFQPGFPPPAPPFPGCGPDPTPEGLGCDATACP